ncbi:MAG: hypothetical protein HUK22_02305, partial [Thermoguttaceae bacterium]|nr:hypothetical protein [Thermoguttaceae bacterium]
YAGARGRAEIENASLRLGYIVLPKTESTLALGAPWSEDELDDADLVVAAVARTIRELWGRVEPNAPICPENWAAGNILTKPAPPFSEYLSRITLDYVYD